MIKNETIRTRLTYYETVTEKELHRLFVEKILSSKSRGIIKNAKITTVEDFDSQDILIKADLEMLKKIPYQKATRRFRRPQFKNNY